MCSLWNHRIFSIFLQFFCWWVRCFRLDGKTLISFANIVIKRSPLSATRAYQIFQDKRQNSFSLKYVIFQRGCVPTFSRVLIYYQKRRKRKKQHNRQIYSSIPRGKDFFLNFHPAKEARKKNHETIFCCRRDR